VDPADLLGQPGVAAGLARRQSPVGRAVGAGCDRPPERGQGLADRLDAEQVLVLVDVGHERCCGRSVKSVQGAVSGPSTGPFPWTASRTRRATFIATGAPQALRWFMFACRQVACSQGEGVVDP